MAVTSIWRVHGRVGKVLDYVENAEKTKCKAEDSLNLAYFRRQRGAQSIKEKYYKF